MVPQLGGALVIKGIKAIRPMILSEVAFKAGPLPFSALKRAQIGPDAAKSG